MRAHSFQQQPPQPAYPAGGVLASMRAAAAMPPRTPQPAHIAANYAAAYAHATPQHAALHAAAAQQQTPRPLAAAYAPPPQMQQHQQQHVLQTPLKSSASTPSFASPAPVPPALSTPAASPVASEAPPRTPAASPGPGTSPPGVAAMSEAEAAKLMQALQHFVLVALQQKSAAAATAATTPGRPAVPEVKNYATLLAQLGAEHNDPLALSRWFLALSKCVASLNSTHHSALLTLLYSFDYATAASVRNVEAFVNLLVSLCVGANVQALPQALRTLVKSFIATNVPVATLSAASVSPALYGRAGDTGAVPTMALGEAAQPLGVSAAGSELPSMDVIHDLVHSALTRLMQLLPSSPSVLFPLLVDLFPHKRLDVTVQLVYVKNLLRVSEYAPSLRDRILTAICERMMHIDVEIVANEDEDSDEEDEEDASHADEAGLELEAATLNGDAMPFGGPDLVFSMSSEGPAGSPAPPAAPPSPPKPLSESRVMANKLDALMCLMFEYLNLIRNANPAASASTPKAAAGKPLAPSATPQTPGTLIANAHAPPPSLTGPNGAGAAPATSSGDLCDEVFSSLLRVFERSILRTHNSRFLQCLLFFFCSFRHVYAETFLKYLLERGFDVAVSSVERQNSALYIASFVARSAFLRQASAGVAFEMLLKWTHAYTLHHIESTQHAMAVQASNAYSRHAAPTTASLAVPEVGPLEAAGHAVFYKLCAAVFYIFCYRQDSLKSLSDSVPDADALAARQRLGELLSSPLNPLRFVPSAVAEEFVRVNALVGHPVHAEHIVARNRRLNQSSLLAGSGANKHGAQRNNGARTASGGAGGGGDSGAVGGLSGGSNLFDPEDIFFPFDPYQLKHSSSYIEGLYMHYQEDEDDDDLSSSDSSDDAESDSEEEMAPGERASASAARTMRGTVAKPIRIMTSPLLAAAGAPGARSNRKRKFRLPGSSFSPALDGLTSSPELEAGMSSMSASFSEQLSLTASPALLGHSDAHGSTAVGQGHMSFEMERGGQFLRLPPSRIGAAAAAPGASSSAAIAIKRKTGSSSRSAAAAANEGGLSRSLRMAEEKSNGGGAGMRKARKQTHKKADQHAVSMQQQSGSSDDEEHEEQQGFTLTEHDLSFSDSPLLNPLQSGPLAQLS